MRSRLALSSLLILSFAAIPVFAQNSNGRNQGGFDARSESLIVEAVNEERAKVGLKPLAVDSRLREAARVHSKDMGDFNFFDHTSPIKGKEKFTDRIKAEGLQRFGTAGENIAAGPFSASARAAGFMKLWMESQGHRENILDSNFEFIGVGIYVTPEGEVFATQEFTKLGIAEGVSNPSPIIEVPNVEAEVELDPDFSGVEEIPFVETPEVVVPKPNQTKRQKSPPQTFAPKQKSQPRSAKRDLSADEVRTLMEEVAAAGYDENSGVTIVVVPTQRGYRWYARPEKQYRRSPQYRRYSRPSYYQKRSRRGSCN